MLECERVFDPKEKTGNPCTFVHRCAVVEIPHCTFSTKILLSLANWFLCVTSFFIICSQISFQFIFPGKPFSQDSLRLFPVVEVSCLAFQEYINTYIHRTFWINATYLSPWKLQQIQNTVTLFDRTSSQLQNTVFQQSPPLADLCGWAHQDVLHFAVWQAAMHVCLQHCLSFHILSSLLKWVMKWTHPLTVLTSTIWSL